MITYNHGKTIDGKYIDISQVNKNEKTKYFCISCENELIPKIGNIREHHFAHKNKNIVCSKENYFHLLGKKIFFDIFAECKNNNDPFLIGIFEKNCAIFNIKSCINSEYKRFNLVEYFKEIEMEKYCGKFIPDLRLFNKNNNEDIFIEIKYSHKISQKKENSDKRIIEINIKSEDDINIIKNKYLSEKDENITFYNLKRNIVQIDDCKHCRNIKGKNNYIEKLQNINKFILLKYNGRIECKTVGLQYFEKIKKEYRYYKVVDPHIDYTKQYNEFITECEMKKYYIIKYPSFW
jgi:hypothetical protein